MSDIAIQVEKLSKRYRLGRQQERYQTLRDRLSTLFFSSFQRASALFRARSTTRLRKNESFWALKDISFQVRNGEVLGIIGYNGAGKTTLLKILSRITEPTEGRAVIYGRVASLLEVGTGFHAELTGRENIYLSGAILGMGRSEINRKFDEIVAFADLEEFIDTPVKHFSSGMYMRLAFAVAAHLEPEILLVDEVLAVGDVGFQRKCLDKMEDVGKSGRTVLFVSHNMAAISNLCGRAILLESGHICMDGRSQDVVQEYANNIRALDTCPIIERVDRKGNGRLKFVDVVLTNVKEEPVNSFMSGQDGVFVLHYNSDENRPLPNVAFAIMFLDMNGNTLFTTWSELTGQTFQELPPHGTISCLIPNIPLVGGRYGFHIWSAVAGQEADYLKHAGFFDVVDADFFSHGKIPLREKHGSLMVPHSWYAS